MATTNEILEQISPYLIYGGLGLLQRGDPFANLTRGLLVGGQVADRDEQRRVAERRRKALEKLSKSLFPEGPAGAVPDPVSTITQQQLMGQGGAALGKMLGPEPPPSALPPGVRPEDLSLGMHQAMRGAAGPPPPTLLDQKIDPTTGRLRPISDAELTAIAPRLPPAAVPASLMPGGGSGGGASSSALAAQGIAASRGAAPPPSDPLSTGPGAMQVVRALVESGDEGLMQQGFALLSRLHGQQADMGFRAQQAGIDRAFRARESEMTRALRREESQRKARLTREENALDRQLRRELAAESERLKLFLSQQKAAKPKDATDAQRKALAGGETMLEGLNRVEARIAQGFDPTSIAGQLVDKLPTSFFTGEERLQFNADYRRVVEGIVQAASGVASDQDVSRMMSLYSPSIGDTRASFRTKYVSLLNDALGIFRRVAGKTPPAMQNPEQQFATQMATELENRIARIEGAEGYEGFSPIAGQGPTIPMPDIDFDTAGLDEIERSLEGL